MILPGDNDVALHTVISGAEDGPVLVFAHALGADLAVWDAVLDHLPRGLRIIRMDMRGHGKSPCPKGPYPMGDLVSDAARILDKHHIRDCVFVGLSIGGIIAQGLAAERLDLVRGLVMSNTAAKIGTPEIWQDRINMVRANGIRAIADSNMERWFARRTRRDNPALVNVARDRLLTTPPEGYLGCMGAIADTDLYESTARLRLPTLAIAGSEDGSTPADLVRETADLIPGSRFELIRNAGHMPPLERPQTYAAVLTGFLQEIGHV